MAIVTSSRYHKVVRKTFAENTRLNENTRCLEWIGALYPTGYGRALRVVGEPAEVRAHRRAWEMAHGEIPNGMDVLHQCDNPRCVNHEHLFLGNDVDNVKDKMRKGRNINLAGAEHGMAKLSPEDTARIREAALFGASYASMGISYGVNEATISAIVKRKIWKHVE
jgi:hypothetical protein